MPPRIAETHAIAAGACPACGHRCSFPGARLALGLLFVTMATCYVPKRRSIQDERSHNRTALSSAPAETAHFRSVPWQPY